MSNKPKDCRYTIKTQSGRYYYIDSANRIIRADMEFSPSGQWTFIGLSDRYGRFITMAHLDSGDTTYKNGKGKYWLHDRDHGTHRIWSDRIVRIWVGGN